MCLHFYFLGEGRRQAHRCRALDVAGFLYLVFLDLSPPISSPSAVYKLDIMAITAAAAAAAATIITTAAAAVTITTTTAYWLATGQLQRSAQAYALWPYDTVIALYDVNI